MPRGNFPTARPQAGEKPTNTWAQPADKSQRVQEQAVSRNGPSASCPCSQPRHDAPHPTASLAGPGHPAAAPWELPGKKLHSLPSSLTADLPLWAAQHLPLTPQHPNTSPEGGGGRIAQPQHLRSCHGQGDGHGGFPLQQGNHARCTQGIQLLHSIQVPEQEWEVEAEAGADTDPGSDSSQDGKGLCLGQNVQTNPKDAACLEGFSQAVAGW